MNFQVLIILLSALLTMAQSPSSTFVLDPYDSKDPYYTSLVRHNLGSLHLNLSARDYSANAALNSPSISWNYDGNLIISRASAIAALEGVVEGSFHGLQLPDIYHVVDGHIGAVLYVLQGIQTGPLAGLPLQENGRFRAMGAELMKFNEEALLEDLITVDPIAIIQAQMSHQIEPSPATNSTLLRENPQTSPEYRAQLKQNLKLLHRNVNAGNAAINANAAVENVEVNENGEVQQGRDAFVKAIAATNAAKGAFPEKKFHDDYVLADGTFGAIEYAWQAAQTSDYAEFKLAEGKQVRMRGFLFFEFNEEGRIVKVVSVYDEGVVTTQLSGKAGYLYP